MSKEAKEFTAVDPTEAADNLAEWLWGRKPRDCKERGICVECGGAATEFNDDLSRQEFWVSGLCQECQDKFFLEE